MEWSQLQEVTPVLRLHALYAVLQVDKGRSREREHLDHRL